MLLHPVGELSKLPDLLTLPSGESADIPQRLGQILRAAARLFHADWYSLVPFNPETRVALETIALPGPADAGCADPPASPRGEGVARRILEAGALFAPDLKELPDLQEPFTREAALRASAAVTLATRPSGVPLAVLYLDYRQPRAFLPEEQAQLRHFADQAALALQQTWLLHRYAEVTRLGQAINSELTTVPHLFERLSSGIAPLLDCSYFFLLAIYEREHDRLTLYYSEQGVGQVLKQEPLEGACRWVITRRQPLLIRHFSVEQLGLPVEPIPIPDTGQLEESLIFVPLLFRDQALGVISVQHPEPNFYDHEDLQVLQLLGNQVALALNTIQLFDGLTQLNTAGRALVQELNLGPERLAQRVADLVRTTTRADLVSLYTTERGQISPSPVVSGWLLKPEHPRVNPPRQDDIALLALRRTRPAFMPDSARLFEEFGGDRALRLGGFTDREQIRSAAVLALRVGDEAVGVLFVNYRQTQRFDAFQRQLIESLASYAAIAIRNAGQYDTVIRYQIEAERQRERAAQGEGRFRLLYDAGRRLTAVTEEHDAYAVVARIAHEHFGCRVAGRRFDAARQRLEPVFEVGNRPEYPATPLPIDEGINGQAARERRTIVVDDIRSLPPELAAARNSDPETRSVIAAPVLFEQAHYGNLALSHPTVGYFQHADVQLIEGLAQQLGNTLNRLEITAARQEAQQRVREAEAMTTIGQAAYELAHRLGNDLGPITPSINQVRAELHRLGVQSELIEHKLEQIAHDKNQVVRLVKRLKDDLAKDNLIGDRSPGHERPQAAALLVRELLEVTAATNALLPENVRVLIECDETVSQVLADYRQVTDLLRNLFANAVEALTPGGGTVTLRARDDGAFVLIEVADTGPGIAPARQGRIFDLFYSTKPEGTGFGLWSARRNALANGGDLTVTSTLGQGAIFRLCLPRALEPSEGAL